MKNLRDLTTANIKHGQQMRKMMQSMPHPKMPSDNDGDEVPPSKKPKKKDRPI